VTADGYVGRERCTSCHAAEAAAFAGSDHDRAMAPATEETVLGDFDGATFSRDGETTRFDRRGGRWFVTTEGADGGRHRYEVRYTFGVRPLQQYLVEMPGGRLQRLPYSWDSRPREDGGQRWFHVYGNERITPSDPLHWTRFSQNWNHMCAGCHSTRLEKGYRPATRDYRTTWSEIDVSCEACHGPAAGHVAWAEAGGDSTVTAKGFGFRITDAGGGAWVRPAKVATARRTAPRTDAALDACAPCHSHRTPIAPHTPGDRLLDDFSPSLLRDPLYFADGQAREEVFVYGSFVQSRMHEAGVTCTDCHDPHRGTLRARGDALCGHCHDPARFASRRHHGHADASAGARCVACHMPERTFMQVDARRDHGFRIPRPLQSEQVGSPDVCAGCHSDRTAAWAAREIARWRGERGRAAGAGFAAAFAAGREGDPFARASLRAIVAGDDPGIVRATAVTLLAVFADTASRSVLRRGTLDRDALVRAAAAGALAVEPADLRTRWLLPLLRDSVRLVRIGAARSLAGVDDAAWPEDDRARLAEGSREYEASLRLSLDDPVSNVLLGDFFAARGAPVRAEAAYREAIAIDPSRVTAYVNLADLLRAQGRDGEGGDLLGQGLEVVPGSAALHYASGLAAVRAQDRASAHDHLARAARLDTLDAAIASAGALALRESGKYDEAIRMLEAGLRQHPYDRGLVLTLVSICEPDDRVLRARPHLARLARAFPEDPRWAAMLERIGSGAAAP